MSRRSRSCRSRAPRSRRQGRTGSGRAPCPAAALRRCPPTRRRRSRALQAAVHMSHLHCQRQLQLSSFDSYTYLSTEGWMADFLTEKRQEIDNRLKELRPLYEEYLKLEKAQEALAGMDQPRRRGPGRPPGSTSRSTPRSAGAGSNGRRRRRRRAGGTRGDQALEVVRQNPGITVSELGDKLGIAQKNYLYRVMANLQEDGAVKKEGKGFHAT